MFGSVHSCQFPLSGILATNTEVILGLMTVPMKNTGNSMVWDKSYISGKVPTCKCLPARPLVSA